MRGNGSEVTADTDREARSDVGRGKVDRSPRRHPSSRVLGAAERDNLLKEARAIEFPIGLRGYDRAAVDRYVERVTRIIAELEMSSSPESAVRHALDEVSEETRDILQHAHQTAEEITARSRAKADDRLQQAEDEAQELLDAAQREAKETRESAQRKAREGQSLREIAQHEVAELRETTRRELTEARETAVRETQQLRAAAQREADEVLATARREAGETLERAETRARELARNAEGIWRERRRLIDDMRAVGDQLVAIGEAEGKRFPAFAEEPLSGDEQAREETSSSALEPVAEEDD
jgi:DivIVA domain-containing protein